MRLKLSLLLLLSSILIQAKNNTETNATNSESNKNDNEYLTLEDIDEKPVESYSNINYTPKNSFVNVPLDINIKTLQKTLNDNLQGLLYEDKKIEDDSLMIKIWKNGEFVINFDGTYLTAEIPLKIWARKRVGIVGLTYTDRDVNAGVKAHIKSKLVISKNWGFITNSQITNYVWTDKPTTSIAGLDVPITYIIDKIIKENKSTLEKLVDQTISSNIPTRQYATDLWKTIQQPIPIQAGDYKAWVNVTPTSILMQPLSAKDGNIKTGFKVDCKVDVMVGNPSKKRQVTVLPDCRLNTQINPALEINLLANVPYPTLDSVAFDALKGEPIGEGKHSIYIDGVKTFGMKDSIVIGVAAHGFIKGNIYLIGKPYFDQEQKSIKLKDVSYQLKTKSALKKALNFVIKPILKKKIEEKLNIPMSENYYLIQQLMNSSIMNSQWATNVYTKGEIDEVDGKDIYITNEGVKVELKIKGKLNVLYK